MLSLKLKAAIWLPIVFGLCRQHYQLHQWLAKLLEFPWETLRDLIGNMRSEEWKMLIIE